MSSYTHKRCLSWKKQSVVIISPCYTFSHQYTTAALFISGLARPIWTQHGNICRFPACKHMLHIHTYTYIFVQYINKDRQKVGICQWLLMVFSWTKHLQILWILRKIYWLKFLTSRIRLKAFTGNIWPIGQMSWMLVIK